MSTTPTLVRNVSDTYVNQGAPAKSYPSARRIYLNSTAGQQKQGFFYFAIPFPRGATLISAKLRFYNDALWTGSRTLTVKPLTAKWARQKCNWNNKPGVAAGSATVTISGAAAGTMWEFNIQSLLQSVSNGTAWYGFRIETNGTANEKLYSSEAIESMRPVVEIAWSDAPDAPEVLRPNGGLAVSVQYPTFQCDFTDVSGDTDIQAIQVLTSTSSTFATTEWDSGAIPVTAPELITDSALPGYQTLPAWSGVAIGATKYWKVRVQDGAGMWSAYSGIESFTRTAYSVFSLDNPASATPFFYENTPPIIWSKTSGTPTQKAYQVIVLDTDGSWLWTSGKITGSALTVTLPKGKNTGGPGFLKQGGTYTVILRIWDNVQRVKIPNDPGYVEISRVVTLNSDAGTSPVTSLAAADAFPYPWVTVTWARATAADEYDIYRNGTPIDTDTAAALSTGGTAYAYTDRTPPPYEQQTYEVRAVVNNKASASNPTVNVTPRSIAPCLSQMDGTSPCFFLNPDAEVDRGAIEEVVEFIGDAPPILITQTRRGFEGTITGLLTDIPGVALSARQQRNNFRLLRRQAGKNLRLTILDEAFRCFIFDAKYVPIADNEGIQYQASFQFVQTDF